MSGVKLTAGSIRVLQNISNADKNTVRSTPGRITPESELGIAPDVYIARTPSSGIPPLMLEAGTGTEDVPGYATCDIYRILHNEGETPKIIPVEEVTKVVYNIYPIFIGGNRWIQITRDKFGAWLPIPPNPYPTFTDWGTGSGTGIDTGTSPPASSLDVGTADSTTQVNCCPNPISTNLTLTLINSTCPAVEGQTTLTWNPATGKWEGTMDEGTCLGVTYTLECQGSLIGEMIFTVNGSQVNFDAGQTSTCDPLALYYKFVSGIPGICGCPNFSVFEYVIMEAA